MQPVEESQNFAYYEADELMNLFDVLPERFFSVLASPARDVYAHILFLLYDLYRHNLFGIPRETVIDSASMYLEEREQGLPDVFIDEAEGTPSGLSPREKANFVLRKLQSTGWLDIEMRTNYEEYINIYDYAIRILDTLDRIRHRRQMEYQSYVYGTYAALSVEDVEKQGALALESAYELTDQLIRELKSLNHNIRHYTERLLKEKRPQDILAAHFLEYQPQVVDRSYHRLKTADNVSKYRPRILQRIDRWLNEPGWTADIARAEVARERYPTLEQAETEIYRQLYFIQSSYLDMDSLLDEIDRRNAQYAKASLDQLRYMLNSSKDTEGQLVDLMVHMAGRITSGTWQKSDSLPPDWSRLFSLYTLDLVDSGSLFTPRQQRRQHEPPSMQETELLTEQEKEARLAHIRQRLSRKLTPDRIDRFIQERLGNRQEARAADLGIETMEDFVKLIYTAIYARNRRVSYTVDFRADDLVRTARDKFEFRNVLIRKKQP